MRVEVLEERAREEGLALKYVPRSGYVVLPSREDKNLLSVTTATGAVSLIAGVQAKERREQTRSRYGGVPKPGKPHVFLIPDESQRRALEDSIADLKAGGGSIHDALPLTAAGAPDTATEDDARPGSSAPRNRRGAGGDGDRYNRGVMGLLTPLVVPGRLVGKLHAPGGADR